MNKSLLAVSLAASCFVAGLASAQVVHDWHDLAKADEHIQQVINELERASIANGEDMNGHANRAVQLLQQAHVEVHLAVQAAQANTSPH
jgi:hypothetical protein